MTVAACHNTTLTDAQQRHVTGFYSGRTLNVEGADSSYFADVPVQTETSFLAATLLSVTQLVICCGLLRKGLWYCEVQDCHAVAGAKRRLSWSQSFGKPGVDGIIILKWIFKKWDGGMDWIDQARDRKGSRVLVNAVMNVLVL